MNIGLVSMMVEIDNEVYAVVLPQDQMRLVVNIAASLGEGGKLPVKPLGKEYKIERLDTTE